MYFIVSIKKNAERTAEVLKLIDLFENQKFAKIKLFPVKLSEDFLQVDPKFFNIKSDATKTTGKFEDKGSKVLVNLNFLKKAQHQVPIYLRKYLSTDINIIFSGDRKAMFENRLFAKTLLFILNNSEDCEVIDYSFYVNHDDSSLAFWQISEYDDIDQTIEKLQAVAQ